MHHSAEADSLRQLDTIFARLNPQEVEQFYAVYKQWLLQQHIASLQERIGHIQRQLAENSQRMQETHPSPIALATLARLQSNGVNDIDLLDDMLARGEAWLDQTMQRLDYCEQFDDFLSDDYTQWCRRALDGAFDWIDSLRDEASPTSLSTSLEAAPPDAEAEETEALLLQKLTSETDEQEELAWQEEVTLKQSAVKLLAPREAAEPLSAESAVEQVEAINRAPTEDAGPEQGDAIDQVPTEDAGPEEDVGPELGDAINRVPTEDAGLEMVDAINRVPTEHVAPEEPPTTEDRWPVSLASSSPKRGLLRRLIGILLGE